MAPPLFHRSSYCFRNSFCKLLFFIFFFCFLGYYLELRYDMYFSVLYRQFNRQRRLRICNAANYWPLEGPSRTCFVKISTKQAFSATTMSELNRQIQQSHCFLSTSTSTRLRVSGRTGLFHSSCFLSQITIEKIKGNTKMRLLPISGQDVMMNNGMSGTEWGNTPTCQS